MSWSPEVSEKALVECGRHCCLCHKFCGVKIELHHIIQKKDGGEDTFENCIPLCFDCHAEAGSYNEKHPKGKKITSSELIKHRNNWYQKIKMGGGSSVSPSHLEKDRETFELLKQLLPSAGGSIEFIRTNNFAGFSFDTEKLKDLHQFIYKCDLPEFEFLDPDIEALRGELKGHIDKFLMKIAFETFPVRGQQNRNEVPPEWEDEQPERFNEVVTFLHEHTSKICDTYDNLIRLGRRKL